MTKGTKLICLLLMLAIFVGGLSSCGHTHIYVDKQDDTAHWRECVCGDKVDEVAHTYTDNHDNTTHWRECSCGKRVDEGVHIGGTATCQAQAVCAVCGTSWGRLSEHQYVEPAYNSVWHWYECECGKKSAETFMHGDPLPKENGNEGSSTGCGGCANSSSLNILFLFVMALLCVPFRKRLFL